MVVLATGAFAALALIAAACVPSAARAGSVARPPAPTDTKAPLEFLILPPDDEPPIAPRMDMPDVLPPGTQLLGTMLYPDRADDHLVTPRGSVPVPPSLATELFLRAIGRLSPQGAELRTLDDGGFVLCDEFEGNDCRTIPTVDANWNARFSPDGRRFAVIDKTFDAADDSDDRWSLKVFDTASLDLIVEAPSAIYFAFTGPVWRSDSGAIAMTVPQPGRPTFWFGALATLEIAPGATPHVIAAGSPGSEPFFEQSVAAESPFGWTEDGRISYSWTDRSSPEQPVTTVRSIDADGSDLRVHGETLESTSGVPLPDGSVIAFGPDEADLVPSLFGPDENQSRPLSRLAPPVGGGPSPDGFFVWGSVGSIGG